ncbi:hypothetical protein BJ165DRAFT_1614630 [Panaeolus papilionaceus]|nr:hypothetical protein BJ165DRAFT_1614630 [Panaeolus papilionaceus]
MTSTNKNYHEGAELTINNRSGIRTMKISHIDLIWGKFYKAGDRQTEIPPADLINHRIEPMGSFTLYMYPRIEQATGMEGSVTIADTEGDVEVVEVIGVSRLSEETPLSENFARIPMVMPVLLRQTYLTLYPTLTLLTLFTTSIERILSRSMTDWMHLDSQNQFIETVKNSARLASYVDRFGIFVAIPNYSDDEETIRKPPLWGNVLVAVDNMCNLQHFILSLQMVEPPASVISNLFSILKARHLRSFSWHTPTLNILGSFPYLEDVNIISQ